MGAPCPDSPETAQTTAEAGICQPRLNLDVNDLPTLIQSEDRAETTKCFVL